MTDIRIRFRHLQCFLTIAQLRGVGAAANALSITQPALSKTLRELEDALGAKLFERDKKGMLLTRTGETFLQHAAASVASLREGIDSIRQSQIASGLEVRIGVLPNVAASLAPQAVQRFKQQSANTAVRVVTGDNARLLDQLRIGELDLVVGRLAQPEYMVGLTFEHLFSEPLTVVVRRHHPLTRATRFKLQVIADYPCVMPYHGTIIRQEIERFLLAQGVHQPTDLVETTSVDFAHAYVQQSDAIWFVPRGYMASAVAQKFLSELPLDTRALEGPVGITIRADTKRTPAAQQMIDVLRVTAESRTTHS
jgi:LysR family pca operon transcriptional activator